MMRGCPDCHYIPWPCVSCGVPRCYCRIDQLYRHHRPAVPEPDPAVALMMKLKAIPLPPFKCGHPITQYNIIKNTKSGQRFCRTCHNEATQRRMRERRAG